ncbi:MAG: alginate export family protein [Pirellulaceae bacterium]
MASDTCGQESYIEPTGSRQYQAESTGADSTAIGAVQHSTTSQVGGVHVSDVGTKNESENKEAEKRQAGLKKKAASAHKPLFFNNDFSYLCDDAYHGCLMGDGLKKRCLPRGGWYDIGGQYRTRYHAEQNLRGLGLTGVDDKFLLHRTRIYGDFHLSQDIRVYAEMLDAESNYENFGPRPIEVNRTEMQNLFVDARLLSNGNNSLTARVGRQELLFGAQRAVSPLDWANTRRTFEGARLMYETKDRKVDAFWTNPVRIDDHSFDSPDRDQEFMGLYSSYTGRKNQTVDTYFLRLLNGRGANDFQYNTIGSRWQGSQGDFLWDFEGAYQFGDNTDGSSHVAGMATFGIGRKLSNRCWKPVLWAYYDWASGDDATGAGNGFHHNFPLAHKYNGFMDLFGRRNIEDVNLQLSMQPSEKLKLLVWYHYFFLETQTDTPYSVVMTPFNGGNLPGSADLGHEIDFVASYKINQRQDIVLGYSHFFSGDYYDTTPGVPFNGDADFFYTQWTVNF